MIEVAMVAFLAHSASDIRVADVRFGILIFPSKPDSLESEITLVDTDQFGMSEQNI